MLGEGENETKQTKHVYVKVKIYKRTQGKREEETRWNEKNTSFKNQKKFVRGCDAGWDTARTEKSNKRKF